MSEDENTVWPYESCWDCRARMPSEEAAEAHYAMTGHQLGWFLEPGADEWPVMSPEQAVRAR
jgi:hypothetical protein